jgi:hydroxymethylglutaryl-CoA reductase (NADPH)
MKHEQVEQVRQPARVAMRDGDMRFRCSTWDAMKMNMVSKDMHDVLNFLQDDFPDMDAISISGWFALLLFW